MKSIIFRSVLVLSVCGCISVVNARQRTIEYSCQTDDSDRQFCVDRYQKPLKEKVYEYHENGTYAAIINFKNGYYDGLVTMFDENGRLVERVYYKKGLKNGMDKVYHSNRTIKLLANYKDGLLDGEQEMYFSDGKPAGRFMYKNGKMQKGHCIRYENGYKHRHDFNLRERREITENKIPCEVQ